MVTTRHAGRRAAEAADTPWTRALMRAGFLARGAVYVLPGYLAFRLATGNGGAAITQTGAIRYLGTTFGQGWVIAMSIGLAGYALWGVVRAILDPLRQGHSPLGIFKRLRYMASALAYAGLLAAALRYLAGEHMPKMPPQPWAAGLLRLHSGPWLVGLLGVCWIVGLGITQIVEGLRGSFVEMLNVGRITGIERAWAIGLGRIGTIGRGVVFTMIGMFLVIAAVHRSPGEAHGMDGALLALARHSFGRVLLAILSLGLVTFGVFSILCVRWARVRVIKHRRPTSMTRHARAAR